MACHHRLEEKPESLEPRLYDPVIACVDKLGKTNPWCNIGSASFSRQHLSNELMSLHLWACSGSALANPGDVLRVHFLLSQCKVHSFLMIVPICLETKPSTAFVRPWVKPLARERKERKKEWEHAFLEDFTLPFLTKLQNHSFSALLLKNYCI